LKIIVDKSLKILVEIELGKFLKINQNLIEKFIIKVGYHQQIYKNQNPN
jgi:hypothetical protein